MTLCPSSEEYLSNGTAFYLSFTLCAADDKLKMQSIKSGGKSSMTLTLKDVMRLSWLYISIQVHISVYSAEIHKYVSLQLLCDIISGLRN